MIARVAGMVAVLTLAACSDQHPSSFTGPNPPVTNGLSSARDERRGVWVVLGGDESFAGGMPTWELDETGWQVVALGGPTTRRYAAMAWDPGRDAVVLFGGENPSGFLGDTWTWSGEAWSRVEGPAPPGRRDHALVWVPPRNALMLYGGYQTDCVGDACQEQWWLGADGWVKEP